MFSVDRYLARKFHPRRYNCAHLVCEVWRDFTGDDLSHVLGGFLCAPSDRKAILSQLRQVKFIDRPASPCVVLMQAPKREPHVGIWLNRRVLHIMQNGVQYMPMDVAALGFKQVRFFTC